MTFVVILFVYQLNLLSSIAKCGRKKREVYDGYLTILLNCRLVNSFS